MSELRIPVRDAEGESVGEIVIREAAGRFRVERTTFINGFAIEVNEATAIGLRVAALAGDWKVLDNHDPELLPWYCRECDRNYAEGRWSVTPQWEDDGWLDSYRGRCPFGHERMIAD